MICIISSSHHIVISSLQALFVSISCEVRPIIKYTGNSPTFPHTHDMIPMPVSQCPQVKTFGLCPHDTTRPLDMRIPFDWNFHLHGACRTAMAAAKPSKPFKCAAWEWAMRQGTDTTQEGWSKTVLISHGMIYYMTVDIYDLHMNHVCFVSKIHIR